ncbi:hypothetical protein REPUB_Repub14bG0099500 [Reevesia pubescens]
MPKKHRAIEGVGASSILELKAQLYKSQEESKKSKELNGPDVEYHRAKKKIAPLNTFILKNSGVDVCALKDKLELKEVNDGSVSYAALEKKAELYDKLVRGELSDEEDKEKYCVDFFRKGIEPEESQQPQVDHASNNLRTRDEDGESDDGPSLLNTKFVGPKEHLESWTMMSISVLEVHEEANQAREIVSELKLQRQEQAAARHEKLRQAYLRKQLEKLKAASKTEHSLLGRARKEICVFFY